MSHPLLRSNSVYTLLLVMALAGAGCKKDAPAAVSASPKAQPAQATAAPTASAAKAEGTTPKPARQARWVQLFVDEAHASSFLKNDWNKFVENYHPKYLFDDNPRTAWVEGAEGNGEGEWVRFSLTDVPRASALKLEVKNGYQKSKKLLVANAAATKLRVVAKYRGLVVGEQTFALKRKMGTQSISLPLTPEKGVDEVRLQIDTTLDGKKWADTCISDVAVFVHTDVRYKPAIEKGKQKRLLAWTKSRLKEAVQFKKISNAYPYVKTSFRVSDESEKAIKCGDCELADLKKTFKKDYAVALTTSMSLSSGESKILAEDDEGVLVPDGLDVLAPFLDEDLLDGYQPGALVRVMGLRWKDPDHENLSDMLDEEDDIDDDEDRREQEEDQEEDEEGGNRYVVSNPEIFRDKKGAVSAIRIEIDEDVEGRETESSVQQTVTMLYEEQRLVAVVTETASKSTVYRDEAPPEGEGADDEQESYTVIVALVEWNKEKTKVQRVRVNNAFSDVHDGPAGQWYRAEYTSAS